MYDCVFKLKDYLIVKYRYYIFKLILVNDLLWLVNLLKCLCVRENINMFKYFDMKNW